MAIPLQLGVQFTPAELWGSDMKTHVGYFGITGRGTETCEGYFGIAERGTETCDGYFGIAERGTETCEGYFGIAGRGTETCEGYFGIAEHNMKTHDQAQKMLPLGKQEHYHTRTKHEHITQPKIQKPC